MTPRSLYVLLAAAGSAALLLAALGAQYLAGIRPCELCTLQRLPHLTAVVIGIGALALGGRLLPALGALAAATTAAIGAYHTGVQRGFWAGPDACTGDAAGLSGLSGAALLDPAAAPGVVLCDQVAWSLFGLSIPSWNALASAVLVLIWLAALRAPGRTQLRLR